MPYVQMQDIRLGMDRKRASRVAAELGSAWTIKNGHLTRGGDVFRRKKFVKQTGSFPDTTRGLFAINDTLYTLGYDASEAGNVPPGITHLLTQHPTPSVEIVAIRDAEAFNGQLYSVIEFADGNIYHYYNTSRVTDWDTLATTIGSNNAVASALAAAIDNSVAVNASASTNVITITSQNAGTPFTISQSTVNNGISPVSYVAPVAEVLAEGDVTITGGSSSPGVNRMVSITINGVDVLGAPVNWVTSNDATATAIANQINSHTSTPNYTATAVGAVITIKAVAGSGTSPNGLAIVTNEGGTLTSTHDATMSGGVAAVAEVLAIDSETITLVQTQANVPAVSEVLATGEVTVTGGTANAGTNNIVSITVDGVNILGGDAEVLATGSFNVTGGTASPGVNMVDEILVNGVDILGAPVDWVTSNNQTATNIRAQINSYNSSPNYTASGTGANVIITAAAGSGSSPNGFVVAPGVAGDVTVGSINNMDDGEYAGVPWTTSNSTTATNIASAINTLTSSPNYTATALGPVVTISAVAGSGSGPNGFVITTVESGDVTTTHDATMDNGVSATSAVAQVYTATIGGTFEAADQFNITINGTEIYTVTGRASGTGISVLTFKQKMYSTASSNLYFSALGAPAQWISGVDYGFINMASQSAGEETLTVAQEYQGLMAIFSQNNIRIWSISEDSSANVFLQTLQNTGTTAPGSVVPYGNNDVFYLDTSGVRSIKARDSSNAAYVSDVGTSIDTHIREFMDTLTEEEIAAAVGVVEPIDGRFWIGIKNRIYVLSYFPAAKISAWSYYEVDFEIQHFAKVGTRIYVRGREDGEDYLYLYGGESNSTYPGINEDICLIELPYFSAENPAAFKELLGFDIIGINDWKVEILPDPANETVITNQGIASGTTYGKPRFGATGVTSLFAVNLTCSAAGPAALSALAMHYSGTFEDG